MAVLVLGTITPIVSLGLNADNQRFTQEGIDNIIIHSSKLNDEDKAIRVDYLKALKNSSKSVELSRFITGTDVIDEDLVIKYPMIEYHGL